MISIQIIPISLVIKKTFDSKRLITRIFMSNLVSFVVVWSSDQILALVAKFRIFCCNVFPLMIPFPLFEFTMEPKKLLVGFEKCLI